MWDGANAGDRFGFVNRVLGDVTGDGVLDIGVGVPLNSGAGGSAGRVYVYCGASGDLIREHAGAVNDFFGYELGAVGDVDGDGLGDYIIGAPETINFQTTFGNGYATLFSGADGAMLHTWTGETFADGFGGQVTGPATSFRMAPVTSTRMVFLTSSSVRRRTGRVDRRSGARTCTPAPTTP